MLEVYDRDLRRVAILENAFDVSEDEKINALGYLYFSLPIDDPKRAFCRPRWYARLDGGALYRILPVGQEQAETGAARYECEHVLAALMDDVLFGYHAPMGGTTAGYLQYILSRQKTKNWVLGRCAFTRYFEYAWEQENLLGALFSVAAPLSGYIWRTDTSAYPWVVHLDALEAAGAPALYLRSGRNLLDYTPDYDYTQLCTRLYPLGYGEGVNQLTIADVNGGVEYIESPPEVIAQYGLISRIWTDRRYENAESLLAAAQAMLAELQEPVVRHEVDVAQLEGDEAPAIGKRVRIVHGGGTVDTYIVGLETVRGEYDEVTVTLANRATDIASTVADLADRQRIEQTYAQGATQLYSQALQGNASRDEGLRMDFFLPAELRIINKVIAKVRLSAFRAYSQATTTTDSETATSSAGGGTTVTSSSGGGTETTTSSGGRTTVTSTSGGGTAETTHGSSNVEYTTGTTTTVEGHEHKIRLVSYHEHEVEIPDHDHDVKIPSHTHEVDIPAHTHKTTIPDHSHGVTIPGHEQDLEDVADFKGSRAEVWLMLFCKQMQISYQKLTEEEKQWLMRIAQKSKLAKGHVSQRGKKRR